MAAVLVADDDADLLDALRRVLEYDGHTVTTARNGAEAIAFVRSLSFNVVITDVMMPDNGGIVVAGMARLYQRNATVVAMSGYLEHVSGQAKSKFLQNLGVAHILKKPIDIEELSAIVHRYANTASESGSPAS